MANVDASQFRNSQGDELKYIEVTISGVPCIELIASSTKDPAKVKQRRKEKDALGRSHLDIPFLDCKIGDQGAKEYNNIIVYSECNQE